MPQLVPFYFMNQLTYGFLLMILLLILFSQFFLPMILRLYVSRLFIYKLIYHKDFKCANKIYI